MVIAQGAARALPLPNRFVKLVVCILALLKRHELVLCVDDLTSLQPRPRKAATLPPQPQLPMRVEHEYQRKGALNLFAAFNTRTGEVWGQTYERKRQVEFIQFLEYLDKQIPPHKAPNPHCVGQSEDAQGSTGASLVGNCILALSSTFPRCIAQRMNQVEQWFGILQPLAATDC